MPSRALALRNAIVTVLKTANPGGVADERIFTDLRQAIQRGQRPAIVVEMGDEENPARDYGTVQRGIGLSVRILADGADPFAVIDPIRLATHAAIMADKTLGGLCKSLEEGASSRDRADLDVPIGSLTTVYLAKYATALEALT